MKRDHLTDCCEHDAKDAKGDIVWCDHCDRRSRISEIAFWSKVDVVGTNCCWIWRGHTIRKGYGRVSMGGRIELAHRASYRLFFGADPGEMLVCHRCDNPSCVNPMHLFLGSNKDNNDDKVRKKRHAVGSRAGVAKLNDDSVREMRALWATGEWTMRALSQKYGVADSGVCRIVRRQMWAHVA